MPLSEGWRDQYERMLRSHERLSEAANPSVMSSDEARDRLYHFFQDAYHLKDWLKNDAAPNLPPSGDVEALFTNPQRSVPTLQLCADLCNGIKHLKLKPTAAKTGDPETGIKQQHVTVFVPTIEASWSVAGAPSSPPVVTPPAPVAQGSHHWTVVSNQQTYDAVELAGGIVSEWEQWLKVEGLL